MWIGFHGCSRELKPLISPPNATAPGFGGANREGLCALRLDYLDDPGRAVSRFLSAPLFLKRSKAPNTRRELTHSRISLPSLQEERGRESFV